MINRLSAQRFYGLSSSPVQQTTANKTQQQEISFKGLSKRMSNKVYNGFYIMAELFPPERINIPISGKLPNFMVQKIKSKTENVEKGIREIFKTFAEVSNELRDFTPEATTTFNEMKNKRHNSTVKKLDTILQKYGIVKPYDEFDIKYIDKGGKGSVYKLEGLRDIKAFDEDEFVIKVFHTKSIQSNAHHGCFPEINAATYWMKHQGFNTNRGKFFWADVNEAYMVNKYIDEDVRLPKYYPTVYNIGLKFTDEDAVHIHNVCKSYSYDWGGCVLINQVVNSNKYARKVMNFIGSQQEKYRLSEWYRLYNSKSNGNYDSMFAGLALGIRSLPNKDRVKCFEDCFRKRGKYTDRALGYTLKYLPDEVSLKYFKLLSKNAKDNVLKQILKNEVPLLSVKDEYKCKIKDDLLILDNAKDFRRKYVDETKLAEYQKIVKENLS